MIGEQHPGVTRCPRRPENVPQSLDERRAVEVIANDRPPLDPPNNDVVQGTWNIETRVTRHGVRMPQSGERSNAVLHPRPLLHDP